MSDLRYVISKKASSDLNAIWLHTLKNWSLEQADRYYNLIFDEIDHICRNPDCGNSMEHVREGYRVTKVKSHLIFFRARKDRIEIIRILHEKMDIDNRLAD